MSLSFKRRDKKSILVCDFASTLLLYNASKLQKKKKKFLKIIIAEYKIFFPFILLRKIIVRFVQKVVFLFCYNIFIIYYLWTIIGAVNMLVI